MHFYVEIYRTITKNRRNKMGLFNFFKSKKKRQEEKRIKEVLKRADDTISRIEAGLNENKKK